MNEDPSVPSDFLSSGSLESAVRRLDVSLIGRAIGNYRITSLLGVGGMGEVYRAHDLKLGRDVAIKVLPPEFVTDSGRHARFDREARLLASLNHPNIGAIHGFEDADAIPALILELVEGETLADRIAREPIPVDEALQIARQIADALDAAHQKGIIHRDLKPANIKLTPSGTVKVLDFGLAKATVSNQDVPQTQGMSIGRTRDGVLLGTSAYMSPEQACGKPVDRSTDVWAFGCVLYEMLSQRQPFAADSITETLAHVLEREPDFDKLPDETPLKLRALIRGCLQKPVQLRVKDMGEVKRQIEDATRSEGLERRATRTYSRVVFLAAGAIALLAISGWALRSRNGVRDTQPPPPEFTQLTSAPGIENNPSLSPDGRDVVYSATPVGETSSDIFFQSVGGQIPVNLTKDSPANDTQPAFSPDGERIAFRSGRDKGGIFIMGRDGGSVRRLTTTGFNPAWTPDGKTIVYATSSATNPEERNLISEAWKVDVASERAERISTGDCMHPAVSPHGLRVACWGVQVTAGPTPRQASGARDISTVSLGSGELRRVTNDAATDWSPMWSPDGRHLYFASDRAGTMNLWRVAIDERSGETRGEPEPVTTPASSIGHLSRSADGRRWAYTAYHTTSNAYRAAFDPIRGAIRSAPVPITTGTLTWDRPEPSPDGASVVLWSNRRQDIFVVRPDGTGMRALTNDGLAFRDRVPRWAPDGTRIAFYSNRDGGWGVWAVSPDGSGLRQLIRPGGRTLIYPLWSPDGTRLLTTDNQARRSYVFAVGREPVSEPLETLPPHPDPTTRFSGRSWSSDGQKIAGTTTNGEAWVYSLRTKTYERITRADVGHSSVAWLNDDRRLLYTLNGRMMLVDTVTKHAQEILAFEGENIGGPTLSRDNREIYFTRGTSGADVWLITYPATPDAESSR
jgi:serine/threonine protein kinase/sugar lactone lactonase YvrE